MPRMLHLGLGAFHRAHQAVFMQRLLDAGEAGWELAAGNLRGDAEDGLRQLQQQQGRYTLETVDPAGVREYTRIEALREVVGWDGHLSRLVALGADPATRIISFTVTEGGYALDAAGQVDLAAPAMQAALAGARQGEPGTTLHGALTAMLRQRMRNGAGAVTLLSCSAATTCATTATARAARCCSSCARWATRAWRSGSKRTPPAPTRWSTASRRGRPPRSCSACAPRRARTIPAR